MNVFSFTYSFKRMGIYFRNALRNVLFFSVPKIRNPIVEIIALSGFIII